MLDALTEAVDNEDIEFSTAIAMKQKSLRLFEVAEYMDVKRRHTEDPVESRRWEVALHAFLRSLEDVELTAEDAEIINGIIKNLEFEAITSDEGASDRDDKVGEETTEEDDNWQQDKFGIALDTETIDKISNLPVFAPAERLARGTTSKAPDLASAIKHVEVYVEGELAEQMLKIIDYYVYRVAEAFAKGNSSRAPNFDNAHNTVDTYGSEAEVKVRMKAALDKYVFISAEIAASGTSSRAPNLKLAKDLIKTYASSPGRHDAMLHKLGFI
ncbi:hypothetical protein COU91_00295 [Candidatus Saccharibacteria bacterium CG10_big_fil_rev_8_21_14_0_10_47_8]|nr:MAG: hypothetical protein COU91_00295 [Candidatus Saccharibacteria bacterium CG10_big_fil_rev_8_21_14_0_10_47_8]